VKKQSKIKAVVGEVYAEPTGLKLAEEVEGNTGWQQLRKGNRMEMIFVRVSHTSIVWKKVVRKSTTFMGYGADYGH